MNRRTFFGKLAALCGVAMASPDVIGYPAKRETIIVGIAPEVTLYGPARYDNMEIEKCIQSVRRLENGGWLDILKADRRIAEVEKKS